MTLISRLKGMKWRTWALSEELGVAIPWHSTRMFKGIKVTDAPDLRPLLIEACEALADILHEGNMATQGKWDSISSNKMKNAAYETLARIEAGLEKLEEGV